jgi:hypothetical protein
VRAYISICSQDNVEVLEEWFTYYHGKNGHDYNNRNRGGVYYLRKLLDDVNVQHIRSPDFEKFLLEEIDDLHDDTTIYNK